MSPSRSPMWSSRAPAALCRHSNRPVAGKTGTKDRTNDDGSSDVVSAWFVAYTRQISTAVMYVAGNDGNGDLDKYARPGDSTFFGGTYPALTWADYMKTAAKGQAVKEFPDPAYVNREEVPQPEPTMQETHSRLIETPQQEPTPPRIKPKWTWRPFPTATQSRKPGGGGKKPPRWRRTPAGLPPAAQVEQKPDRRDRGPIRPTSCHRRLTASSAQSASESAGLSDGAAAGWAWWNPLRVTLLVGTLVYLSGVVFRLPCRITVAGGLHPTISSTCATPISACCTPVAACSKATPLPRRRRLPGSGVPGAHRLVSGTGASDHPRARRLQGTDLTEQQRVDSTLIFVDVNTVLLGALFLVALWAWCVRRPGGPGTR